MWGRRAACQTGCGFPNLQLLIRNNTDGHDPSAGIETLSFKQTFNPTTTAWLTPTEIVPARHVRFNAQIDF